MNAPRFSKWPALLVIVRHAESLANRHRDLLRESRRRDTHLNLPTRDVDVPLTDHGRAQARATGRHLRGQCPPFHAAYVSPYERTRQTADLLLAELARPPRERIIEERLREKEFGILEGLTKHGIRALREEEHERKERIGKYYYRPPGGESYPDVNLRVHSFLGTLVREHASENVLVVTHSVVVLCFRRLLERMEEQQVLELDRTDDVKNASLLVYESEPGPGGLARRAWNLAPWETAIDAVNPIS